MLSDTLNYTATNSACQLNEHGALRLFLLGVKHYFIVLFIHAYRILPSVESVILKTLVSDSESLVQCSNHTLMHSNFRSIFVDTCSMGNLGVKLKCISCTYVCVYVCMCVYMRVLIFIHWLYMYLNIYCYFYYHHYIINFCVFEVAYLPWMMLVFEFFPVISEAPPPSPSLVQNVRLLHSFLLLSWCTKMSTSLWNEWFH